MKQDGKFAGLFDERLKSDTAGRPRAGKRSHPDYKQFSVLLKRATHKQATRILADLDNGKDLSDIMEELLQEWVQKQAIHA